MAMLFGWLDNCTSFIALAVCYRLVVYQSARSEAFNWEMSTLPILPCEVLHPVEFIGDGW